MHVGDLEDAPGIGSSSAMAVVANWELNKQMEDLSVSLLSIRSVFQVNTNKSFLKNGRSLFCTKKRVSKSIKAHYNLGS